MTGLYAATLVPWIISNVSFIPANLSLVILRRQEPRLLAQAGLFLLRVVIMASAAIFDIDVLTTLWIFSFTSAGYNFLAIIGAIYLLAIDEPQTPQEAATIRRNNA